ncbi:MAG: hypothetical protein E6K13_00645 [Methanobacteriota archaeon]|nr:MAG: hypothetical protein E6K13_00645 [Euryarchaeota archaeon]
MGNELRRAEPGSQPMALSRIKTHVQGLDEALSGGLPEGYVTLVSGAPGTMKSSFCFSILYQNALREGRKSAYFTLEQGKDILLEHMTELGFTDEKAFKNLLILDMGAVRKNLNFLKARGTWIDLFKMYASNFMKAEKISLLVVDSLEVMEAMAKFTDRRSDMYYLFDWLRDLGTTSLIISENPVENPVVGHYPEEAYLADGIIQLGLHPTTDLYVQRRLRCMKMRSTKHETGFYALTFDDGAFEVTRAVSGN